MAESRDQAALSATDYDAIAEAVMETARGRWFLAEYARRNRTADTQLLLDAIARLEQRIAAPRGAEHRSPEPLPAELAELAATIRATRRDIAAVRNDLMPGGGAIAPGRDAIAAVAETVSAEAARLVEKTEAIQALARELRDAGLAPERCDALDALIDELFQACWQGDIASQRVGKAVSLLGHLEQRLVAMLPESARRSPGEGPARPWTAENTASLPYFAQDEDLFADRARKHPAAPALAPHAAAPAVAATEGRIVIIRTPAARPGRIPLLDPGADDPARGPAASPSPAANVKAPSRKLPAMRPPSDRATKLERSAI